MSEKVFVAQSCQILCNRMDCSLCPGDSLGKNTGVVAIPFSMGFSWPRDQTWVSYIAGRFFTIWATRKSKKQDNHDTSVWIIIESPDSGSDK